MNCGSVIPVPLTEVEVPANFGPSVLARFRGCRLQLVLAGRKRPDFLAPGPEAAVGRLIHRVAELWGKGEGSDPQTLFALLAEASRSELAEDPVTAPYANLSSTMTHAAWLDVRTTAVSKCKPRGDRPLPPAGVDHAWGPTGVEKSIVSDRLRLSARVDRIIRVGTKGLLIKDHKTGRVRNDDGSLREEIAFQLRLYGMVAQERFPECEVMLVVDSGDEITVSFTKEDVAKATERLSMILTPLPAHAKIAAEDIAVPGESCLRCQARPACPAYRRVAPEWWKVHPQEMLRIPQDVWGAILESRTSAGRTSLRVLDAAGRAVKISNLGERSDVSVAVGAQAWFFNLVATGTARGWNGQPFHPHAFHELPRDRGERRAWGLRIFRGGASQAASPTT